MRKEEYPIHSLFSKNSKPEAVELMKQMGAEIDKVTFPVEYTVEQLTDLKNKFTERSIELRKMKEDFELVKSEWKERMKPVENEAELLIREIRLKHEEITEEVILVPDHKKKVMDYVTLDGMIVYTRPMTTEENQLKLVANE